MSFTEFHIVLQNCCPDGAYHNTGCLSNELFIINTCSVIANNSYWETDRCTVSMATVNIRVIVTGTVGAWTTERMVTVSSKWLSRVSWTHGPLHVSIIQSTNTVQQQLPKLGANKQNNSTADFQHSTIHITTNFTTYQLIVIQLHHILSYCISLYLYVSYVILKNLINLFILCKVAVWQLILKSHLIDLLSHYSTLTSLTEKSAQVVYKCSTLRNPTKTGNTCKFGTDDQDTGYTILLWSSNKGHCIKRYDLDNLMTSFTTLWSQQCKKNISSIYQYILQVMSQIYIQPTCKVKIIFMYVLSVVWHWKGNWPAKCLRLKPKWFALSTCNYEH